MENKELYYDFETTNFSFLSVHRELEKQGIRNNKFMLVLHDTSLLNIDPYNPKLTNEEKAKVMAECSINIWYFFREIVRLPVQGSRYMVEDDDPTSKTFYPESGYNRFTLDLSSCAQIYLAEKRKNSWVTKSRQLYKTTTCHLLCIYVGIFPPLGARYRKERINIYTFDKKDRINHEKFLLSALPDYMRLINVATYSVPVPKVGSTHRKYIISDTTYKVPTFVYFCEAEYIEDIDQLYKDVLDLQRGDPRTLELYKTNYPFMSIIAEGAICDETKAIELINNSMRWENVFYDFSNDDLDELTAHIDTELFHIDFEWYELGINQEWYDRMCTILNHDPDVIRREIDCKRKK